MNDHPQRWDQVGAAIATRIKKLNMTKAEVIRQSGVSQKTLDGYIAGEPIVRADKRRGLCEALHWTPDSIDAILEGGSPMDDAVFIVDGKEVTLEEDAAETAKGVTVPPAWLRLARRLDKIEADNADIRRLLEAVARQVGVVEPGELPEQAAARPAQPT